MLAMNLRTPLGVRLPTLSLTFIASMLAPTRAGSLTNSYPNHLFSTVRNMIYFVQSYTARASQPSANKLSTTPPTANGDNCGIVENFFHKSQRKSVTYPEHGFSMAADQLLIKLLKRTIHVACSGSQTPYPQKRQQTLGATLAPLWKSAESHDFRGFAQGITVKNLSLINF